MGRWKLVGIAALVAGCATGSDVSDVTDDDAATDGSGDLGHDAAGSHPGDASHPKDAPNDTTFPVGDDDSSTPGDDTGGGDDTGSGDDTGGGDDASDANEIDAEDAGGVDAHDANVADTNLPDTNGPDTSVADAGHDTGAKDANVPDTNGPDTSAPDTGADAGCSPTGSSYTKKIHQPAVTPLACTSSQVTTFYNDCMGNNASQSACSGWENALANIQCATCLAGATDPSGTTWGPYLDYTADQIVEIDLGGCILADGAGTTCGDDLEYQTECEHAACDLSCQGHSLGDVQACITAADNGPCKAETTAVNTACGSVFSTCFSGSDFQSAFTAVAAVFCE